MSSEAYRNPGTEPCGSQTAGLDTALDAYSTTVKIKVELFGAPRLHAGCREVELELPSNVDRHQVVRALARACPALVGTALREDLTDVQDGYVFNQNGVSFLGGESFCLRSGDSLLLLSNQAGG